MMAKGGNYVTTGKSLAHGLLCSAAKQLGVAPETISTKATREAVGRVLDVWREEKLKEHAYEIIMQERWDKLMNNEIRMAEFRAKKERKRLARAPARVSRFLQQALGLSEDAVWVLSILTMVPVVMFCFVAAIRWLAQG